MTGTLRPIPVSAASAIAKRYGYDQVVLIARTVGDGGGEHVTTYGRDKENCGVAARVGNFLKHKIMGWPGFPGDDQIVMPRKPTESMIQSMNAMARAMLESVNVIDVSLIYGTAVQCEISKAALAEAGFDENGEPL